MQVQVVTAEGEDSPYGWKPEEKQVSLDMQLNGVSIGTLLLIRPEPGLSSTLKATNKTGLNSIVFLQNHEQGSFVSNTICVQATPGGTNEVHFDLWNLAILTTTLSNTVHTVSSTSGVQSVCDLRNFKRSSFFVRLDPQSALYLKDTPTAITLYHGGELWTIQFTKSTSFLIIRGVTATALLEDILTGALVIVDPGVIIPEYEVSRIPPERLMFPREYPSSRSEILQMMIAFIIMRSSMKALTEDEKGRLRGRGDDRRKLTRDVGGSSFGMRLKNQELDDDSSDEETILRDVNVGSDALKKKDKMHPLEAELEAEKDELEF